MGFVKFLVAIIGGAIVALSIATPIVSLTPDKDAGPYAGAALVGAFLTIATAMRGVGIRGAISNIFGWLFWSAVLQVAAAFAIVMLPKPPIHLWIMRQFMAEGGWVWFAVAAVASAVLAAVFRPPVGGGAQSQQGRRRKKQARPHPAAPAPVQTAPQPAAPAPAIAGNPVISGRRNVDIIQRG